MRQLLEALHVARVIAQRLADRVLGPGDDVGAAGPDGRAREVGLLLVGLERAPGIPIMDGVGLHDCDPWARNEAQRLLASAAVRQHREQQRAIARKRGNGVRVLLPSDQPPEVHDESVGAGDKKRNAVDTRDVGDLDQRRPIELRRAEREKRHFTQREMQAEPLGRHPNHGDDQRERQSQLAIHYAQQNRERDQQWCVQRRDGERHGLMKE